MLLNWDILTDAMSFLDRADASRMSRACRTLLQAAPVVLLRGEIFLWTPWRLLSFYRFMSRAEHTGSPYQYLRQLKLTYSGRWLNTIPQFGKLITEIFEHATELQSLKVYGSDVLEADDRTAPAVAVLTKLYSLEIHDLTESTFHILKMMHAPLTKIEIALFGFTNPVDPTPVLLRFTDTLQTLDVSNAVFMSTDVQYPHLSTLTTQFCFFNELRPVVHCFPNLQVLHMHTINEETSTSMEIEWRRLASVASQEHCSWTSLHRLSGSVLCLYMLGVQCRVDHLKLASAMGTAEDSRRLTMVLSDAHPASLDLALTLPDFNVSLLAGALAPVTHILTQLMLHLEFHGIVYEDPRPRIVSVIPSNFAVLLTTSC